MNPRNQNRAKSCALRAPWGCKSWTIKKAECWRIDAFQMVVLVKTLESPLISKEIKPVNPKGNQPWIFIERTDANALILWPPDAKSWLTGKDPNAGKDWRKKKGVTEDEMVRWHHQLNGHELEQTPGDSGGQRSLVQSMGSQRAGHNLATEQQLQLTLKLGWKGVNKKEKLCR